MPILRESQYFPVFMGGIQVKSMIGLSSPKLWSLILIAFVFAFVLFWNWIWSTKGLSDWEIEISAP